MSPITGVIKVINIPDDACLTTVRELMQSLEDYLAVELPVESITNVYVSSTEPDVTDRDILWFRIDNAGNFIGIFVFVQGEWQQMFPVIGATHLIAGDSRDIQPGYELVTEDTPGFTSEMVDKLMTLWVEGEDPSYHVLFHVVYVGL